MMTMTRIDDEMKVPYISKELCEYLRDVFSLPHVLHAVMSSNPTKGDGDMVVGYMTGVNMVIERLEALQVQQEEHDGIH